MLIEEFKVGEYYYSELKDRVPKRFFITKCLGHYDNSRIEGVYISNMDHVDKFTLERSWPCVISDCRTTRIATFEEKYWLNKCIRLDKFIPFEQTQIQNQTYEIF